MLGYIQNVACRVKWLVGSFQIDLGDAQGFGITMFYIPALCKYNCSSGYRYAVACCFMLSKDSWSWFILIIWRV